MRRRAFNTENSPVPDVTGAKLRSHVLEGREPGRDLDLFDYVVFSVGRGFISPVICLIVGGDKLHGNRFYSSFGLFLFGLNSARHSRCTLNS